MGFFVVLPGSFYREKIENKDQGLIKKNAEENRGRMVTTRIWEIKKNIIKYVIRSEIQLRN